MSAVKIGGVAVIGVVAAAIAVQVPELRRYMRIRSM
jgi:hypothetical protein